MILLIYFGGGSMILKPDCPDVLLKRQILVEKVKLSSFQCLSSETNGIPDKLRICLSTLISCFGLGIVTLRLRRRNSVFFLRSGLGFTSGFVLRYLEG